MSQPRAGLTRRELEILRLVAQGHANSQVAKILWVTDQTIKFHLISMYRKLGVSNRTEASHWAVAQGLVRPGDDLQDDPEPGGVREPRRPIKPTRIGGIALDLPEDDELAGDEPTRDAPSEAA